jgi:hypothetical protein
VNLHLPDPLTLLDIGHLEQDMGANSALERRIDVGGQIGGEDDHSGESLQLMQEHVHDAVGFTLVSRVHGRKPPSGNGIGLIEEQHGILASG